MITAVEWLGEGNIFEKAGDWVRNGLGHFLLNDVWNPFMTLALPLASILCLSGWMVFLATHDQRSKTFVFKVFIIFFLLKVIDSVI